MSLNPIQPVRQLLEIFREIVPPYVQLVVFGGELPRADVDGMRRMAADLRVHADRMGGTADEARKLLAEVPAAGQFASRLQELMNTSQDNAAKLREQARVLADQADGTANEAEKTLCVMVVFGVDLTWRIGRTIAFAMAAGPGGALAAAAKVERMLADAAREGALMKSGLRAAIAHQAAKAVAQLAELGPARIAVTVGLAPAVDAGTQWAQVVAGYRDAAPIGADGSNPRGIDLNSIVAAGAASAAGLVGGLAVGASAPAALQNTIAGRLAVGLTHGVVGAGAGLAGAAMVTGWPQNAEQFLGAMLNGAAGGLVGAYSGPHSPSVTHDPVLDGSGIHSAPDLRGQRVGLLADMPSDPTDFRIGTSVGLRAGTRLEGSGSPPRTEPFEPAPATGELPPPERPHALAAADPAGSRSAANRTTVSAPEHETLGAEPRSFRRASGESPLATPEEPAAAHAMVGESRGARTDATDSSTRTSDTRATHTPAVAKVESPRGDRETPPHPSAAHAGATPPARGAGTPESPHSAAPVGADASGRPVDRPPGSVTPPVTAAPVGRAPDTPVAGQSRDTPHSATPRPLPNSDNPEAAVPQQRTASDAGPERVSAPKRADAPAGHEPPDSGHTPDPVPERMPGESSREYQQRLTRDVADDLGAMAEGDPVRKGNPSEAEQDHFETTAKRAAKLYELRQRQLSTESWEQRRHVMEHSEPVEALMRCIDSVRAGTGMTPRWNQIEAFLLGERGFMREMGTSQGKSIVGAMDALQQLSRGTPVETADGSQVRAHHVITTTETLANEAIRDFSSTFRSLGYEASRWDPLQPKPDPEQPTVYYMTYNELASATLSDCVPVGRTVTIDEADAVLVYDQTTHYQSEGGPTPASAPEKTQVLAVRDFLRKILKQRVLTSADLRHRPEFAMAEAAHRWEAERGRPPTTRESAMIRAYFDVKGGRLVRRRDFNVFDNQIQLLDEHGKPRSDPKTKTDSRMFGGYHQMLEAMYSDGKTHQVQIMADSQGSRHVTVEDVMSRYDRLQLMSGTLERTSGEIAENFPVQGGLAKIKNFGPSNLTVEADRVFLTDRERLRDAVELVRDMHAKGRPVLVICPYNDVAVKFNGMLRKAMKQDLQEAGADPDAVEAGLERINFIGTNWFSEHRDNEAAERNLLGIKDKAGEEGAITIGTTMLGRGFDVSISQKVDGLGGLHAHSLGRRNPDADWQSASRAGRGYNPETGTGYNGSASFGVALTDELFRGAQQPRWPVAVTHYHAAVAEHAAAVAEYRAAQPAGESHTTAESRRVVEARAKVKDAWQAVEDAVREQTPEIQEAAAEQARHARAAARAYRANAPPAGFSQTASTPWDTVSQQAVFDLHRPGVFTQQVTDDDDSDAPADLGTRLRTLLRDPAAVIEPGPSSDDPAVRLRTVLAHADSSSPIVRALGAHLDDHLGRVGTGTVTPLTPIADQSAPQTLRTMTGRRDDLAEALGWDRSETIGAEGIRHVDAALSRTRETFATVLGRTPDEVTTETARQVLADSATALLGSDESDPADEIRAAAAMAFLLTGTLLELVVALHRRSPNACVNNAVTARRVLYGSRHGRLPGDPPLGGHKRAAIERALDGTFGSFESLDEAADSLSNRPGGSLALTYKWMDNAGTVTSHMVVVVNDSEQISSPNLVVLDLAAIDDLSPQDLMDARALLERAVPWRQWRRQQQPFVARLSAADKGVIAVDFDRAGEAMSVPTDRVAPPVRGDSPFARTGRGPESEEPAPADATLPEPSAPSTAHGRRDESHTARAGLRLPDGATVGERSEWAGGLTDTQLVDTLGAVHTVIADHISAFRSGQPGSAETAVDVARTQIVLVAEQWKRLVASGFEDFALIRPVLADAVAGVADIAGALSAPIKGGGHIFDVLGDCADRLSVISRTGPGQDADMAHWAEVADSYLTGRAEHGWDRAVLQALRAPLLHIDESGTVSGTENFSGEAVAQYLSHALTTTRYFLNRTTDRDEAIERLGRVDRDIAAIAHRLGPSSHAATVSAQVLQLRLDIHRILATTPDGAGRSIRAVLDRAPDLPHVFAGHAGELHDLDQDRAMAGTPRPYSTTPVGSPELFEHPAFRDELSDGYQPQVIVPRGGRFYTPRSPALQPLTDDTVSFVMDRWGRMIGEGSHDGLFWLLSAIGEDAAGWGVLATDGDSELALTSPYAADPREVLGTHQYPLTSPMNTAQLRDVLARGAFTVTPEILNNRESQSKIWRGDYFPVADLFTMEDVTGPWGSVEATFSIEGGHLWVAPHATGIFRSADEVRVPVTLGSLDGADGFVEVVVRREGDHTTVGYDNPDPGIEPEQAAVVFDALHDMMTRWVAASQNCTWQTGTDAAGGTFRHGTDAVAAPPADGDSGTSASTTSTPSDGQPSTPWSGAGRESTPAEPGRGTAEATRAHSETAAAQQNSAEPQEERTIPSEVSEESGKLGDPALPADFDADWLHAFGEYYEEAREQAVVVGTAASLAPFGDALAGLESIELSVPESLYRKLADDTAWIALPTEPRIPSASHPGDVWPRESDGRPPLERGRFVVSVGWHGLWTSRNRPSAVLPAVSHGGLHASAWRLGQPIPGIPIPSDVRVAKLQQVYAQAQYQDDQESAGLIKAMLVDRDRAPLPKEALVQANSTVTEILREVSADLGKSISEQLADPTVQNAIGFVSEGVYLSETLRGDLGIGRANQIFRDEDGDRFLESLSFHRDGNISDGLRSVVENGIRQNIELKNILLAMAAYAWSNSRIDLGEGFDEQVSTKLVGAHAKKYGLEDESLVLQSAVHHASSHFYTRGRHGDVFSYIGSPRGVVEQLASAAITESRFRPTAVVDAIRRAAAELSTSGSRGPGFILAHMNMFDNEVKDISDALFLLGLWPEGRRQFAAALREEVDYFINFVHDPRVSILGNREMQRDHVEKIRSIAHRIETDSSYRPLDALREAEIHADNMRAEYRNIEWQLTVPVSIDPSIDAQRISKTLMTRLPGGNHPATVGPIVDGILRVGELVGPSVRPTTSSTLVITMLRRPDDDRPILRAQLEFRAARHTVPSTAELMRTLSDVDCRYTFEHELPTSMTSGPVYRVTLEFDYPITEDGRNRSGSADTATGRVAIPIPFGAHPDVIARRTHSLVQDALWLEHDITALTPAVRELIARSGATEVEVSDNAEVAHGHNRVWTRRKSLDMRAGHWTLHMTRLSDSSTAVRMRFPITSESGRGDSYADAHAALTALIPNRPEFVASLAGRVADFGTGHLTVTVVDDRNEHAAELVYDGIDSASVVHREAIPEPVPEPVPELNPEPEAAVQSEPAPIEMPGQPKSQNTVKTRIFFCTKDRPDRMEKLLSDIAEVFPGVHEVVVVDDSVDWTNRARNKALLDNAPFRTAYINEARRRRLVDAIKWPSREAEEYANSYGFKELGNKPWDHARARAFLQLLAKILGSDEDQVLLVDDDIGMTDGEMDGVKYEVDSQAMREFFASPIPEKTLIGADYIGQQDLPVLQHIMFAIEAGVVGNFEYIPTYDKNERIVELSGSVTASGAWLGTRKEALGIPVPNGYNEDCLYIATLIAMGFKVVMAPFRPLHTGDGRMKRVKMDLAHLQIVGAVVQQAYEAALDEVGLDDLPMLVERAVGYCRPFAERHTQAWRKYFTDKNMQIGEIHEKNVYRLTDAEAVAREAAASITTYIQNLEGWRLLVSDQGVIDHIRKEIDKLAVK